MKKAIAALLGVVSVSLSGCGAFSEDMALPMMENTLQATETEPTTVLQLVRQMRRDTFAEMDRNRDGSLAGAELRGTFSKEDMAAMDRNRDGKLSFQEFDAALSQFQPEEEMVRFLTGLINACRKAADDNQDGMLERAEFLKFFSHEPQAAKAFARGDKNRDGALTGSELEVAVVWLQSQALKSAR